MAWEGGRAVVTGGAGFIGSHVCDRFLTAGYEVVALDDLSTGRRDNIPDGARFEEIDIVDPESTRRLFRQFRPTVICHLGAQSSVTVSVRTPDRDLDVNVKGTFNVLQAAADHSAPVVFASTGGALYGDDAPVPTGEDDFFPEPIAPYGASKLAGEAYVATWGRLHGIPNVVLRLGNVYGARQTPYGEAGVVAIFSDRLRRGERPTVYGDGKQTRDYIHVSDVSNAFAAAAEGARAGTFNVGTGRESTVLQLLDALQAVAGTSIEPTFEPLREGELKRSALDSSRLRSELDWRPQVELEQGLADTFSTYE
ncbi:MAG: NAD-dependent epimerase/dehydratase family protein [Gaiellaceae bacterium]